MSIPPGQPPNPYQQNNPNPNPYAQQQPQGSVPQQYPYAQPTMPAGVPLANQAGAGAPPGQPPGAPAGQPAGMPPGAPPGAPAKKSVPGWLWGLGGLVVASAVWAGVLFATGGFSDEEPEAVLGYAFEKDLCGSTELKAFDERYDVEQSAEDATGWGSQQDGLDQSFCSWNLTDREADSSDYSSSYLSSSAIWHEASDPTGEFAATYKGFEDRSTDDYEYRTEPVGDLGEEAFLVREDSGGDSSSRSMSLAVRDGWFTYEMDWSYYGGGTDSAEPPSYDEVERMLKAEMKAALAGLAEK
ncbi:hypothetical protein [Streptomyces sp. MAR4 CNX-425]|uniref:hypothetical protein n=1 Tax=Streptomyces sp. MAR4 CNX-425 TaxID=3406343 RepID=UPI003B504262